MKKPKTTVKEAKSSVSIMPYLSTNLPNIKFPNANPTIVNENNTETSPRLKLNSFCISGRTITIAHIPMFKDVPIRNVIKSLNQE